MDDDDFLVDHLSEETVEDLPTKWVICQQCEGEGHHGPGWVLTQSDVAEMGDEFYEYMDNMKRGVYDQQCTPCHGTGKVRAVDTSRLNQGQITDLEREIESYYQYQAEVEAERRWGY